MRRSFTRAAWVFGALALLGLGFGAGASAGAAGWADGLFSEQAHDFGPVPRGAKVRHAFVLTNRSNESVSVLNVRASCGCTSGRATAAVVRPGETAAVEVEMDTRNFVGKKATVLYVTLANASGREAEVRLGVSSNILSDVVLNPGTVDFGNVGRGQAVSQTLTIDRVGMPDWRVERMVSSCKVIDARLTETLRNETNVGYLLRVTLRADAPAGVVRDEIRLLTNDPEARVVPVQVTANLRGEVSASPALLSMGRVAPGGGAQGTFLVRASRPFAVRSVEGDGGGFKATVDNAEARPVHLVTVRYNPEAEASRGDVRRVFRVHTDVPGEPPVDLTTSLQVAP